MSCGRLSCQACCGTNTDCCPIPPLGCCPNNPYTPPRKLYLTIVDQDGIWPCIGGSKTFEFNFKTRFGGAGFYWVAYLLNNEEVLTYAEHTILCSGVVGYSTPTSIPNCNEVINTDCNRDLQIYGTLYLKDGFMGQGCEIQLDIQLSGKARYWRYNYSSGNYNLWICEVFTLNESGGIDEIGRYPTWHHDNKQINCSVDLPINYESTANIRKCAAVPYDSNPPTLNSAFHYGANADGTVKILVTE